MKQAAKVFIILGMVIQFFLIFPIVVGCIALKKIKAATRASDLQGIGIVSIFFCSVLGGAFMLAIKDSELSGENEIQNLYNENKKSYKKSKKLNLFNVNTKTAFIILSVFTLLFTIVALVLSRIMPKTIYKCAEYAYENCISWEEYNNNEESLYIILKFNLELSILVGISICFAIYMFISSIINSHKLKTSNIICASINLGFGSVTEAIAILFFIKLNGLMNSVNKNEFIVLLTFIFVFTFFSLTCNIFFLIFSAIHKKVPKNVKFEEKRGSRNQFEDELSYLLKMYKENIITEEEYKDLRKEVLNKFKRINI